MDQPENQPMKELLERIRRLECETAGLRQKVGDLEVAVQKDVVSISEHLIYIYQRLENFFWPVFHKVFPKYSATMEQGEALLKGRPPRDRS